jgi:hypothetical protein
LRYQNRLVRVSLKLPHKGASCPGPVFTGIPRYFSVFFPVLVPDSYKNHNILLSCFYHFMSPSTLKIHLKSVLFLKSCRNLCVSMPMCIHDTFQWLCLFTNLMSDFAFGKICQKISGIFEKSLAPLPQNPRLSSTLSGFSESYANATSSIAMGQRRRLVRDRRQCASPLFTKNL